MENFGIWFGIGKFGIKKYQIRYWKKLSNKSWICLFETWFCQNYRFWNFSLFLDFLGFVIEKFGYWRKYRIHYRENLSLKKVLDSVLKKLGTEKVSDSIPKNLVSEKGVGVWAHTGIRAAWTFSRNPSILVIPSGPKWGSYLWRFCQPGWKSLKSRI